MIPVEGAFNLGKYSCEPEIIVEAEGYEETGSAAEAEFEFRKSGY